MWPDKVIRAFKNIPPNPSEEDYQGPYNKLLNSLFPVESEFTVVPRYLQDPENTAEFTTAFDVLLVDEPVLILDLNPFSHLSFPSKRLAADYRIRTRMIDAVETQSCPLAKLYAVSALGTKLCFHSHNTRNAEIILPDIPNCGLIRTAPAANRWDCDILEPDGEKRLRQIVKKIMSMDDS